MRCASPLTVVWAGALFAFGCPGELENPERFYDGGTTLTGSCETDLDVEADILAGCGGSACHAAESPAADLDLVTPGIVERLANVASGSAECSGETLIVAGSAEDSLLYQKLLPDPSCGIRMPPGDPLDDDALACVAAWIDALDAPDSDADAGTSDADAGTEEE